MTTLGQAGARILSFFQKHKLDHDFEEELAAHLELATQDYIRQGLPLPEARRRAMIKLGGIEPAKELHRESRGLPWLDGVVQDVRYAVRALRRSPGFTLTAIATLAVGIGVNATVFAVTNAVLFKGFPLVERNERIVYISGNGCCVSYPDFEDWRAQAKSFQGMAIVHGLPAMLSIDGGYPESHDITEVSAETFKLVGQKPIIGRDFMPADEIDGAPPVAILRYGFWEHRYGKDPAIIGRTIRINANLATVIGVMAPGFLFPQNQELWVPLVQTPTVRKRDARDTWFVFGRLADGVTIQSARTEMETIARRLAIAYPLTDQAFLPTVQTFQQFYLGPNAAMIYGCMWGAVGFVLLIACANLANLMLARAIGRSREISLRIALGAGRWRIIRQLLIESVMLSSLGGLSAWWLAQWGVRTYQSAASPPSWLDHVVDYSMDYRVFAYLIVISIGTGLLFGLAPAARLSTLDVNAALKDGGRGATGGGRGKHLSAILVIAEMALAVVLLAGAGVMIRSFLKIYTADLGVQTANLFVAHITLPAGRYPRAEQQVAFFDRLKPHLEAVPGVEAVAIASAFPTQGLAHLPYEVAGMPPVSISGSIGMGDRRQPRLSPLVAGPGYFRTVGATVLSGREFNDFDGASASPVVIVNQLFAAKFWPAGNAIGQRLRVFHGTTPEAWLTVVGVVSNIVQNDRTRQSFDALIYLPYRQKPAGDMWVFARTHAPPGTLATAFRREIQAMDPDPSVFFLQTLDKLLETRYGNNGFFAILFVLFAAIALLLASIGLYAVIAQSVSQRTQEIGIRIAIGGTASDIRRLILLQGLFPTAIGLAIGLAVSFAVTPVLKSMLVQVSPSDPPTLIGASAVLIFAATLGCLIPARRAIRVDPAVTLRHE